MERLQLYRLLLNRCTKGGITRYFKSMQIGGSMNKRSLVVAFGIFFVLVLSTVAFFKRDRFLFLFEPDGSRVVLVQYLMEQGHQKSRAAGYFDSFDKCEKERERLPIGGGFVLGGVCVRESQWRELSH